MKIPVFHEGEKVTEFDSALLSAGALRFLGKLLTRHITEAGNVFLSTSSSKWIDVCERKTDNPVPSGVTTPMFDTNGDWLGDKMWPGLPPASFYDDGGLQYLAIHTPAGLGYFAGGWTCEPDDAMLKHKYPKIGVKAPINRIERADVDGFRSEFELGSDTLDNLADRYQHIAGKSAIYPGKGSPHGIMYCGLKLNGEAGEAAEHIGKAMRDDGFGDYTASGSTPLTPERRALIIKELGDITWYVQQTATELGVLFSEVLLTNLEKLCDRGERDALSGSGDER